MSFFVIIIPLFGTTTDGGPHGQGMVPMSPPSQRHRRPPWSLPLRPPFPSASLTSSVAVFITSLLLLISWNQVTSALNAFPEEFNNMPPSTANGDALGRCTLPYHLIRCLVCLSGGEAGSHHKSLRSAGCPLGDADPRFVPKGALFHSLPCYLSPST
ncbi:unnamed protein product [Cyprideis torosa]|uniref:Uncharacterized protein n=1 Tax=Cyprideis torosa TaxID=163714 RepID=A0A7R8WGL4_9CRUS|nr:unnamed protein product [Cyprideis torosa]CAG0892255.1 unnamed protein product [Cyprideis torosa]